MGSNQTPNEVLLNYPKLKGGKGLYARPVIPDRTLSRLRSANNQRASASKMLNASFLSKEVEELHFQCNKSRESAKDGGDYAVMHRPSVVARMSGLSYVRSESATHSRRKLNSASFPNRSAKSRMTNRTASLASAMTRPTSAYSVFSTATATTNNKSLNIIEIPSYKNDYYRCLAMKDVEQFRNTQFGQHLSSDSMVSSLRQESRYRRLRRMTTQDFLAYKNARNPIESMSKVFSLRVALRMVVWKNRALATLAREREDLEATRKRKNYIKELFLKTSKAIVVVYRWYRSLVEQSKEKTIKSAIELQWEATYMEEHKLKKYEFDKANFSHKKATKMPQWMRVILRKTPEDRTKNEINQLHNMLRGLSHYDRFTYKVQMELCKACSLIETEPMRVILRQGHKGHSFYFIYTGSVFINMSQYNPKSKKHFQKTVAILTRGEGFGEVALLKDTERMASVISREWCELLSVDKETFAKQCPQLFDDEIHNRLNYLQKHELFIEGWDSLALYNLALSTNTLETTINQVVSKNESEDTSMYFVMDGSCVVIKCLFIESHDINSASVSFPDNNSSFDDVIRANDLGNQSDSDGADEVDFLRIQKEEAELNAMKQNEGGATTDKLDQSTLAKPGLFDQLDLTYGRGGEKKGMLEEMALVKRDTNLEAKLEAQQKKELETMKSNTNSFSVYMDLTEKSARLQNKIAVFMEVGRLKEGDIFNLRENMKPLDKQNQTILVSETAKLLQMEISHFTHSLRNQDLYLLLTKKITHLKKNFPTDKEMIKLYKLNCNWEAYRQTVVNRVKKEKKQDCRQSEEVMNFLGKPWKTDPDKWLRELKTKQRNLDLKLNEPLKPPIY